MPYRRSPSTAGSGAYVPAAVLSTTGDVTTALQALLTAATNAGGGYVYVPLGSYTITAPLVIGSNTILELHPGATVTLTAGSNCQMVTNAAYTASRSVSDLATTASSTTVTSATAAFVSGDVGKAVRIYYGAPSGTANFLDTTVASVTNGTTAVLAAAPAVTLTNAAASIGPRDKNIVIRGGSWVRANGNGSTSSLTTISILIRRCDRVWIERQSWTSTDGKYAIGLGDVTDYRTWDLAFNTYSDGVHINGPAFRGEIKRLSGTVGDDLVGITCNDAAAGFGTVAEVNGPIETLTVEDCVISALQNGGATPNAVAVYGDVGGTFTTKDVTIRRVAEKATTSQRSVMLKDVLRDITVEDCTGNVTLTAVSVAANTMNGIRIKRQRFKYAGSGITMPVQVLGVTVDDLDVDGVTMMPETTTTIIDVVVVAPGSTVNTLTIRNAHLETKSGRLLNIYGAGTTVTHAILDGCRRDGLDYSAARAVDVGTSGTLTRLTLTAPHFNRCQWPINISQSAGCTVAVSGGRIEGVNDVRADTSAIRLRSAGCSWSGNGVVTANSGTVALNGFDFICDVSKLAKNVGDYAYNNSNANTGTLGVGPVVCIAAGTAPNWRSLVSTNTF